MLSLALAGLASLGGCNELPPLTAEGEHVSVGSDVVPEICAGTLAHYDFVSESLADRFGVEPELLHELHFVAHDGSTKLCGYGAGCATKSRVIVLVGENAIDSALHTVAVHEMAHNYSLSLSGRGRPFLEEGLASAMDTGCLAFDPDLETLLEAPTSTKLNDASGYCAAGNFMRWLVETEGPKAVLDFKRSVSARGKAGPVMKAYTKHFGRSLAEDFGLHHEETRVRRIHECFPELAPALEGSGSYRSLAVETDCDDPRVESSFANPEDLLVRWRLELRPDEAGPWQLLGSLGVGESAEIRVKPNECHAPTNFGGSQIFASTGSPPTRVWLGPGTYTLTLITPREAPASFANLISGPCTLGAGDCQAGHRCDGEVCIPAASEPSSMGDPCGYTPDRDDPCAEGSRCVGPPLSSSSPVTFEGRCVGVCRQDTDCPLDQRCHASGLCGSECDPATPVCLDTDLCVSGWNDSASVCLPDGQFHATQCRHDNDCASGSVCERPGLREHEIGCGVLSPCSCEQLCSLGEGGDMPPCPEDRPLCLSDPDGLRATCKRAPLE